MVRNRCNEEQPETSKPINVFRNDGSFLEMFKKLQETGGDGGSQPASSSTSAPTSSTETDCVDGNIQSNQCTDNKDKKTPSESKPGSSRPLSGIVGKRRGGRVLPTGKVKKARVEAPEEEEKPHKDAWSLYMAEVKRYKQSTCEEEGKTRPLVK